MNQRELKKLLREDKLEELFEKLRKLVQERAITDLAEQLTLLEGRFNEYKREQNQGLLKEEDQRRGRAQIRAAMLDLIRQLPGEALKQEAPAKPTTDPKKRNYKWIIFAVLMLLLLWTALAPVANLNFKADLDAKALRFRIASAWELDHRISLDQFEAVNLNYLALPDTTFAASPPENFELYIDSGRVDISEFKLNSGAVLSMLLDFDDLSINMEDDSLSMDLNIYRGPVDVPDRYQTYVNYTGNGPPELLKFKAAPGAGLNLSFCDSCTATFAFPSISSIEFTQRSVTDPSQIVSSILGGALSVRGSPAKISMREKDALLLDKLKQGQVSFNKSGDLLKVDISAQAQNVRVRQSNGTVTSLKPTRLEYLFHTSMPLFVLAVLLFLAALAVTFRIL